MRSIQDILRGTKYSENQIELFWAECFFDYGYFAEHVLGYDLAEYHKEWFILLEKWPRLCLIAFRGSGKTCFLAGYYIWKAIFIPNQNFLIISTRLDQSKVILKLIRKMIADNEILKQFMPETRESSWKATELNMKTGATFYCRTYGENVRGLRIDWLLCDEAEEYEDKAIFWSAISPVVQLNRGRICVIGTKKSSVDLLAELEDNPEYFSKEYPVVQDGIVLWPQKYTNADFDTNTQRSLQKVRKEIGELPYNQEYLLIPISSENSLFPYELISKGISENECFLPFGRQDERYYVGYDYALSPKGDWVVITVIGVNSNRKRVVKMLRFRGDADEQIAHLRRIDQDFHPVKINFDATGLGEDQARRIVREFTNAEAVKFTYEEKYKILIDLRIEFERLNLEIPMGKKDMDTYTFCSELIKELNEFTLQTDLRPGQTTRQKFHSGKYDDCVISLALANRASTNAYGTVSIRGF